MDLLGGKRTKSKEEIAAEVRAHVEGEKTAHLNVERLVLANKVSEDELSTILNTMMVHHYVDTTEERSISSLCGYPVCSNILPKRKKHKFHISLKQQKVFDMTEHQYFCGDFCFKASKFLQNQIPKEPIWLRSKENKLKLSFLHKEDVQNVRVTTEGDIEDDLQPQVERPVQKKKHPTKSANDAFDRFDEFVAEEEIRYHKVRTPTEPTDVKWETTSVNRTDKLYEASPSLSTGLVTTSTTQALPDSEIQMIASLEKLKNVLQEWLQGYTFPAKQQQQQNTDTKTTILDKKTWVKQDSGKTEDFSAKAFSFLSNNPEWSHEATLSENFQQKMQLKNSETSEQHFSQEQHNMPLVDWKSQILLRKKIVREKITSSLNKLQHVLELNKSDFAQLGFFSSLDKLKYTKENIVLKPREWIMMTICLISVYSEECKEIEASIVKNKTDLDKFLQNENLPTLVRLKSVCPDIHSGDNDLTSVVNEELDSDDDNTESDESENDDYGDNIFPSDSVSCFEEGLPTIGEFDADFEELD